MFLPTTSNFRVGYDYYKVTHRLLVHVVVFYLAESIKVQIVDRYIYI